MTNEQLRMQMLAGVITESQYKAKLQENEEKDSLNESMIGGIVGVGAITQIPPREKTDYEDAFDHFLGGRYGLDSLLKEEEQSNPVSFNSIESMNDYLINGGYDELDGYGNKELNIINKHIKSDIIDAGKTLNPRLLNSLLVKLERKYNWY